MSVSSNIIREHSSAGSTTPGRADLLDLGSLMRVKNLELRAKIVVEGMMAGLHRSPYHGFSVEFTDYRQYSPGDDTRFLDWKLMARTDRCFIKRFEDETNLRCHLIVDFSRSMGFGSLEYNKSEYARTLAATLAYFLAKQRDAVGLLTFDEQIGDFIEPRYRPGHLRRLMLALERSQAGAATDIDAALNQVAHTVNRRGVMVLISDLLAPIESLGKNLGYLVSRGHDVVILRILDPAEIEFDFQSPAMFEDQETGRQLYVDPAASRDSYLKRFHQHADQLTEIARDLGIELHSLSTAVPMGEVLLDFIGSRARAASQLSRRRGNTNPLAPARGAGGVGRSGSGSGSSGGSSMVQSGWKAGRTSAGRTSAGRTSAGRTSAGRTGTVADGGAE